MPLAIIGNNFEAVWKAHEVQEYLRPNDGQDSHETETADRQDCHCKLVDLKHYIFVDDYYSLSFASTRRRSQNVRMERLGWLTVVLVLDNNTSVSSPHFKTPSRIPLPLSYVCRNCSIPC